ncbi:MAG: hypothetical protein LUH20_01585 [Lachnospiraceae bacterium]|nr:hypothetical protein [Lachnospiraceae bacterium]
MKEKETEATTRQTQKSNQKNSSRSPQNLTKYRSLLLPLLIIIIYTIYQFVGGGAAADFAWSETSVTVICPDETEFTIDYADVTSLELCTDANYGTCISGNDSGSAYYGTWENDLWGTYSLCVTQSIGNCIVMQTDDATFVINYESEEITSALFEEIQKYCDAATVQAAAFFHTGYISRYISYC